MSIRVSIWIADFTASISMGEFHQENNLQSATENNCKPSTCILKGTNYMSKHELKKELESFDKKKLIDLISDFYYQIYY